MKYPKEYLEEIKTRLKVSTVISKSVNLKKRGKEFVGLSPFKNEKTPSFTVNDEKGFYHCFSTGEHGNIFDFLMKTQNLKFGEAVRALSSLAGMRPYTFSKQDEARERLFKTYTSLFEKYIEISHRNINNQNNLQLMDYLKTRNITKQIVQKFQLGYSNFNNSLYMDLVNNYDEKVLKLSGLFYLDEKKKIFIDRFRGRLIFPIFDISSNPIALGGRIIEDKNFLAKYLNSPETPFFKKGSNLYNLNKARKLSNKIESVFIVEGYMDVIGLCQNGIENVVANLGTSLTSKQIGILNQFFNHIIICFDGDKGGYNAARRAAENSIIDLQPQKKISFLFLPDNEDPDTFIKKKGKDFFLNFANEKIIEIHEFIFQDYKKNTEDNPSSLALFEKKLRNLANSIKDQFIRKYTLEYFLDKISELTPNIKIKGSKSFLKTNKSLKITQNYFNESKSFSSVEMKEFSLLCLLFKNISFFTNNINLISGIKFFTKENSMVLNKIISEIQNKDVKVLKDLSIDKQIIEKIFKFSSIRYILDENNIDESKIIDFLNELKRDLKNIELEKRIEELESKFSRDFSENTFNELKELKKQQKIN